MKNFFILLFMLITVGLCWAQAPIMPSLWLRADSTGVETNYWHDVSGNGFDVFPTSGLMSSTFSKMNFNRCFDLFENQQFTISSNALVTKEMEAIIVYETNDPTAENGLWSLLLDTTGRIGLTTHRILSEQGQIIYDTINSCKPVINYLSQSWETPSSNLKTLRIGIADSVPFSGRLSEFILFDTRIADTVRTQWLSYLAIKNGTTLRRTNYLDSRRHCIWNYGEQYEHSASIVGIGRDDAMGLHQRHTYFADNRMVFGLGHPTDDSQDCSSILADGDFIIMGTDSCGMSVTSQLSLADGCTFKTIGQSVVQVTGSCPSQYGTYLQVAETPLSASPQNHICALLIDRSGTGAYPLEVVEMIYPDAIDTAGNLMFLDLHWDTDGSGTDAFCFVMHSIDSTFNFRSSASDDQESNSEKKFANQYRLSPNPNAGKYRLEIELAETSDVTVTVSTTTGKIIRTMSGQGDKSYLFEGNETTPGLYLFDIRSSLEYKTLKMIVQ